MVSQFWQTSSLVLESRGEEQSSGHEDSSELRRTSVLGCDSLCFIRIIPLVIALRGAIKLDFWKNLGSCPNRLDLEKSIFQGILLFLLFLNTFGNGWSTCCYRSQFCLWIPACSSGLLLLHPSYRVSLLGFQLLYDIVENHDHDHAGRCWHKRCTSSLGC